MPTIDILAIAAHRDDVEQTCGGTLLAMNARGWRTGILDLTQGESGTRGTAADRAAEPQAAASLLPGRAAIPTPTPLPPLATKPASSAVWPRWRHPAIRTLRIAPTRSST